MRLNVPIPKGWDETFAELTLEDIVEAIAKAQVSKAKAFRREFTILTPGRMVTITVESRP